MQVENVVRHDIPKEVTDVFGTLCQKPKRNSNIVKHVNVVGDVFTPKSLQQLMTGSNRINDIIDVFTPKILEQLMAGSHGIDGIIRAYQVKLEQSGDRALFAEATIKKLREQIYVNAFYNSRTDHLYSEINRLEIENLGLRQQLNTPIHDNNIEAVIDIIVEDESNEKATTVV